MHGMLSSAVVLAAFAVIAGAGGYVAVWLYRAGPGGPAPSRSRPEPRASGRAGEPAGDGAHDQAIGPDGTGWPGESAVTDDAAVLDEAGGARVPEEPEDPQEADPSDDDEGTGWPAGSTGARVYVLGQPRTQGR